MNQLGTGLVGSTTYKKLFKSTLGPVDIVSVTFPAANDSFKMGAALRDSAVAGQKAEYTNAISVDKEAVGTGDGSVSGFDLAHGNIIASSLKVFVAGIERGYTLGVGTGASGDKVTLDVAPASGAAVTAKYDYYSNTKGAAGACILMNDVTTTTAAKAFADGARDGSVDSALVLDSAGVAVDKYFKAALPKVTFD